MAKNKVVKNKKGKKTSLSILKDIAELKKTKEELRESREYYKLLINEYIPYSEHARRLGVITTKNAVFAKSFNVRGGDFIVFEHIHSGGIEVSWRICRI